MMAVRARRHTHDPGPPPQAVTSEPFLILAVTGSSRPGDVAHYLGLPCFPAVLRCVVASDPSLAAGFGVGTATAWRYVEETVALLAARAPGLRKAVRDAARAGHSCVVLDGTLIPADRVAADRPFYSGKHKKHGMNLQVIARPRGDILWVSGALPGSVHDKKAEWML
jgi:hypothetical protein